MMKNVVLALIVFAAILLPLVPITSGLMLKQALADGPCSAGGLYTPKTANAPATCTYSIEGTPYVQILDDNGNPNGAATAIPLAGVTTFDNKGTPVATPANCTNWQGYIGDFGTCFGRSLSYLIGSTLIYIGAWFLALAGLVFNWLVDTTIIQFGTFYLKIKPAVEQAWTAFRDIANILIIGMFTFIAVGTVIGLQTYNARKMVAKVLIIAVVINFSLLFTKMIVDASNFTSTQIYAAAGFRTGVAGQGNQPSTTVGTNGDPNSSTGVNPFSGGYASAGIAGQFIDLMGVQSLSSTWDSLAQIAKANDSGWVALLHGIFAAIVLLGAAGVLFYGAFLIVARAILMIFLLVTSAIAFASYLVPRWAGSDYGWDKWLSALLRNAVFAPFLMLFLWVTLTVGYKLRPTPTPGGPSLGGLLSDPTKAGNLNAFFIYVLILGMLYVSFKFSSMWAGRIAGFSFGSDLLKQALGVPLALGFGAAGIAGRLGGRFAALRAESYGEDVDRAKMLLARAQSKPGLAHHVPQLEETVRRLERNKNIASALSKSSFALGNTQIGKQLSKALGVSPRFMGQGAEGFGKKAQQTADEAAKRATDLTVSNDDAHTQAKADVEFERREQRRRFKETRDQTAALVQTAKETADATKKSEQLLDKQATAMENLKVAEDSASKEKVAIREKHDPAIEQMESQYASAADDAARQRIRQDIDARKTARKNELDQQDDRINRARGTLNTINARLGTLDKPVREMEKKLGQATKNYTDFLSEDNKLIEQRRNDILKASRDEAQVLAGNIAHRRPSNIIPRILGESPDNDYTSRLARKTGKKKIRVKGLKDRLQATKELEKEADDEGGSSSANSSEEKK